MTADDEDRIFAKVLVMCVAGWVSKRSPGRKMRSRFVDGGEPVNEIEGLTSLSYSESVRECSHLLALDPCKENAVKSISSYVHGLTLWACEFA